MAKFQVGDRIIDMDEVVRNDSTVAGVVTLHLRSGEQISYQLTEEVNVHRMSFLTARNLYGKHLMAMMEHNAAIDGEPKTLDEVIEGRKLVQSMCEAANDLQAAARGCEGTLNLNEREVLVSIKVLLEEGNARVAELDKKEAQLRGFHPY